MWGDIPTLEVARGCNGLRPSSGEPFQAEAFIGARLACSFGI